MRSQGGPQPLPVLFDVGEDAVQLTFNETTVLRFGGTDPLDGHRYVQTGEQVHLIPNRYQPLLEARREFWLSRRLLPQDARIVLLTLPDLTLRRDNEGHWQPEPEDPELGTDELVALIQRWERSEALAVNRDTGTATGGAQVTVHLEGREAPVRFAIRTDGEDRLFLRPDLGLAYRLADQQARRLLEPHPVMEALPALP